MFFFLFRYFRGLKEYTYNEEYPLYQYFAGGKNVYTGKVTLTMDDNITKIETDDGVEDIEDAPIYFQDVSNEVLLGKNMLLVIPRLVSKNYRINAFSKVVYEDDSKNAYYNFGKEKIFLEESFLYDGANLYLFLSNVNVVIDEEIYDKKLDKYTIIETHNKDVIATLGTHKINMSVDMVNDNRLLLKSTENLPIYKGNK